MFVTLIVENNDKQLIGLLQKEQILLVQVEQSPNGERKVEGEARFWAVEVNVSNLINAIHTIEEGVAVHNQAFSCLTEVAVTVEKCL